MRTTAWWATGFASRVTTDLVARPCTLVRRSEIGSRRLRLDVAGAPSIAHCIRRPIGFDRRGRDSSALTAHATSFLRAVNRLVVAVTGSLRWRCKKISANSVLNSALPSGMEAVHSLRWRRQWTSRVRPRGNASSPVCRAQCRLRTNGSRPSIDGLSRNIDHGHSGECHHQSPLP